MSWRLFCLMILVAASIKPAQAASDAVIERSIRNTHLSEDGTFFQSNEVLIRLITDQGAKSLAQVPIPYSESLQTLELVEAYTLKADGTRLDVSRDRVFTQAAPVAVSAPMFNDLKYKIIVFPEPQPGGKLYYRVNVNQITPHFPGHFSALEPLLTQVAVESLVTRVSAPPGMRLLAEARGAKGGKQEDKDGRQRWEWTFRNETAVVPEPFSVSALDHGPYIAISSFKDWQELSKAYQSRVRDKIVVSPAIQGLADRITTGKTDKREQAKALYEWVAQNVRYVGVFLGLGGYVPRKADEILETKYGDCKDHTVILESLLKAKGIESTSVLVNTQPAFTLPKVPVIGAFNHAITYLPELDIYLDGTATFHRFGTMPRPNSGKPVLHVSNGELKTTPAQIAALNTIYNKVDLKLLPDGTLHGKSRINASGAGESSLRQRVNSVPANQKDQFVQRWLGSSVKASGTVSSGDPTDLSRSFELSAEYQIQDAVTLQSPGAFSMPRGMILHPIHEAVTSGGLNRTQRLTAFLCASEEQVEDISLELPKGVEVMAVPKNVEYRQGTLDFEAKYSQDGQKINVYRKLKRERPAEFCHPTTWADTLKMQDTLARDARSQVLLR
jgi:transglutaminase-like putative cysteine protease